MTTTSRGATPDDCRLEVEAEVDSNRSGSFEVERKTRNTAGADAFKFRAVNRASGEVCVARVRI